MLGKGDGFPDPFVDLVGAVLFDKEPRQARLGHIGRDALGVDRLASALESLAIDIRREDLQTKVFSRPSHFLHKQHDDGIGLLARRATGNPNTQRTRIIFFLNQGNDDLLAQILKGLSVAKKTRDADQHVLRKLRSLIRILVQEAIIIGNLRDLVQRHAALDAALDRAPFVTAKVAFVLIDQQIENRRDHVV